MDGGKLLCFFFTRCALLRCVRAGMLELKFSWPGKLDVGSLLE